MKQSLEPRQVPSRVREFQNKAVSYIETTYPNDDVECDVYAFDDDVSRDLAIIQVKPQGATPKQRVLLGERTLEGYLSGVGEFWLNDEVYVFPNKSCSEVTAVIGDVMQWRAGEETLVFYEVCTPPYVDGRFEEVV